jgi:hypothetical protein
VLAKSGSPLRDCRGVEAIIRRSVLILNSRVPRAKRESMILRTHLVDNNSERNFHAASSLSLCGIVGHSRSFL